MSTAFPVAVASGTADVTAYTVDRDTTGIVKLMGWSFHETAATPAAAEIIIRDGTSTAGPIVAVINLAGDASQSVWCGPEGIHISTGVFIDRVAGTTEGAVYIA